MAKNTEIHIRDPFVVPVAEEKRYYLYGTRGPECCRTCVQWMRRITLIS